MKIDTASSLGYIPSAPPSQHLNSILSCRLGAPTRACNCCNTVVLFPSSLGLYTSIFSFPPILASYAPFSRPSALQSIVYIAEVFQSFYLDRQCSFYPQSRVPTLLQYYTMSGPMVAGPTWIDGDEESGPDSEPWACR